LCCGVNHRPSGPESRGPHEGRPYLMGISPPRSKEPVRRDPSGGVASPRLVSTSVLRSSLLRRDGPKSLSLSHESQVCAACPTLHRPLEPRGFGAVMPAATTLRQSDQPPALRAVPRIPREEVVGRPVCLAGWPRVAYLLPFSRGLLRQRTGRDCRGHPHRSRLDPPSVRR
jgi:hypothetical protein